MLVSRRRTTGIINARGGFTFVEVVVVLILLALATALVAPALIFREDEESSVLKPVVDGTRKLAARRGELLYLHVAEDGNWRVEGGASLEEGAIAGGQLGRDYEGPAFTLVVAPIGTCGLDLKSAGVARAVDIDPLTCEVRSP